MIWLQLSWKICHFPVSLKHIFFTGRIGDIPEDDVYVCESKYQEPELTIKKLGKGLKVKLTKISYITICHGKVIA